MLLKICSCLTHRRADIHRIEKIRKLSLNCLWKKNLLPVCDNITPGYKRPKINKKYRDFYLSTESMLRDSHVILLNFTWISGGIIFKLVKRFHLIIKWLLNQLDEKKPQRSQSWNVWKYAVDGLFVMAIRGKQEDHSCEAVIQYPAFMLTR